MISLDSRRAVVILKGACLLEPLRMGEVVQRDHGLNACCMHGVKHGLQAK